jgi:hypothetical protein
MTQPLIDLTRLSGVFARGEQWRPRDDTPHTIRPSVKVQVDHANNLAVFYRPVGNKVAERQHREPIPTFLRRYEPVDARARETLDGLVREALDRVEASGVEVRPAEVVRMITEEEEPVEQAPVVETAPIEEQPARKGSVPGHFGQARALTTEVAREIVGLYLTGSTVPELASAYPVRKSSIWKLVNRQSYFRDTADLFEAHDLRLKEQPQEETVIEDNDLPEPPVHIHTQAVTPVVATTAREMTADILDLAEASLMLAQAYATGRRLPGYVSVPAIEDLAERVRKTYEEHDR